MAKDVNFFSKVATFSPNLVTLSRRDESANLTTSFKHVGERQVGDHDVRVVRCVRAQLVHAGAGAGDDVLV